MAKNREPEKVVESQSESIEEEEEDASSEEVDSHETDSELELTQVSRKAPSSTPATQKKTQPQPPAKAQQQRDSSSDEEDSGSESESESDGPDRNVKPIASKPMDDPQKSNSGAKKPRSRPSAPEPATPTKSTATKRPAEEKETEAKDAKKAKKKADPETSEKKSNLFQRLWSEDDEIAILKGMIDYASKKKADPVADLNAFHDFIKKNLHVDVTRTQLQDKIRRLKKKYENNKSKEKDGKERNFSKPHEHRAYELSKVVWGSESGKDNGGEKVVGSPKANGSAVRKAPSKRANVADSEEVKDGKGAELVVADGEKLLPAKGLNPAGGSVEQMVLTSGAELYEAGKGLDGEREWKKLRMEEMELYLRQLEVRAAQTKLVLDVLKSADN